jgi:hypothetical protein
MGSSGGLILQARDLELLQFPESRWLRPNRPAWFVIENLTQQLASKTAVDRIFSNCPSSENPRSTAAVRAT